MAAVITAVIISASAQASFFVAGSTKPEEEPIVKASPKTPGFNPVIDPGYLALEKILIDAGVDLTDYRHLGLDKPIFKESPVRQKAMEEFKKYVTRNYHRQEAYHAQYYLCIITDEIVHQEWSLTQLEMDNGKRRWEAIEQYKIMEERFPAFKDMDVILYRHANALLEYGIMLEAESIARKLIAAYPQSEFREIAEYYLARIELARNNPGEAYRLLSTVVDIKGKYIDPAAISLYSAKCLYEIAQYGHWQPDYLLLFNKITQYVEKSLGKEDFNKDEAVALYKEAGRNLIDALNPGSDLLSLQEGRKLLQSLAWRSSAEPLKSALAELIKEQSYRIAAEYRRLGDTAFNRSKSKQQQAEAQKHYAQALLECPDHPEADYLHFRNSLSYFNVGRFSEAVGEMRQVTDKYPDSQYAMKAQYNIGFYLGASMKEYYEGAREMERYVQKYPGSELAPQALFFAGTFYQLMEDNPRAIKQFTLLARNYPSDKRSEWAKELVEKIAAAENEKETQKKAGQGAGEAAR